MEQRVTSVKNPLSIVWFRRDLRLKDNPALFEAARAGAILAVYIHEAGTAGAASQCWLQKSLAALESQLKARGLALILRQGPPLETLLELAKGSGAQRVLWNRLYEPGTLARDKAVKAGLLAAGLGAQSFNGSLLREPWELKTQQGKPYQVFTPFYRALVEAGPSRESLGPLPKLQGPAKAPKSVSLASLALRPKIGWDKELYEAWKPGEDEAQKALRRFLRQAASRYQEGRDKVALEDGTSLLSPRLHFGELSPQQCWEAALGFGAAEPAAAGGALAFNRQLAWREFSHHLLYHFPRTVSEPLRPEFKAFPWRRNAALLKAWQQGRTGFPIVDAGLRQLWRTGFMHNRVRMIAASVLIKDFLIDWRQGAAWFMDTLLDADLAQNTLGWQWSAGCGADAAPFFRIFNPALQGQRFDPQGDYVRRWVPELAALPDKFIHQPWLAPAKTGYPAPIVDHAEARERALELFKGLRAGKKAVSPKGTA